MASHPSQSIEYGLINGYKFPVELYSKDAGMARRNSEFGMRNSELLGEKVLVYAAGRMTYEGEAETIAEEPRFSPSPVSCADILPRWGKNRIV